MMRKEISALFMMLLVGCDSSNATRELAIKFEKFKPTLDRLREIASQDTSSDNCFIVGSERIGNYFNRNGAWVLVGEYDKVFELPSVLEATGLQRQRYDEYVTKLASLSAEKITYCKRGQSGGEFSVLISSSGFCDRTISWSSENYRTESKGSGGDFHKVEPLTDGWYVEVSCS